MLPNIANLIARGTLIAKSETQIKPVQHISKSLAVGQQLTGFVQSSDTNEGATLKFSDFSLKVKLPLSLAIGQNVTVEIVETGKEPTVRLINISAETRPVLSEQGKNISTLLNASANSSLTTTITSTSSITQSPAQLSNTAEMAGLLKQTVESSGVFYESHLQKWVTGQKTLQDIHREPQAKTPAQNVFQQAAISQVTGMPIAQDSLVALVNTQLQAMETASLTWQGTICPKQEMSWEIKRERGEAGSQDKQLERPWTTTLKVDFPNVGPVTARISLLKDKISVQLITEDPDSTALLTSNKDTLSKSLHDAGLLPSAISVFTDE